MGVYCRCWAPRPAGEEGRHHHRFRGEEAEELVETLRLEKASLIRAVSTCEAILTTRKCRLDDAMRFAGLAENRAKRAEGDAIAAFRDAAEAFAVKNRDLALQVVARRKQCALETPAWREGHDLLLSALRAQHEQLSARLADRRRLNWWTTEELVGLGRTSDTLYRLGDQETCGLAAMREQNDQLSTEIDRTTQEVGRLQDANEDDILPAQGPLDLERLLRGVTLTDLDIVQLEKDLSTSRHLREAASQELDEAIALRRQILETSTADALAEERSSGSEPEEISVLLARIERRITTNSTVRLAAQTFNESRISSAPLSPQWYFASPDRINQSQRERARDDPLRYAAADETSAPIMGTPEYSDVPVPSFASVATPSPRRRWGQRDIEISQIGEGRGTHELAQAEACNRALQQKVQHMRKQLEEQRLRQDIERLQQEQQFVHGEAFELTRLQREISEPPSPEFEEERRMLELERIEQERLRQEIIARASDVGMRAALDAMVISSPVQAACT